MADMNTRTHPLMVIAATTVILTCLLAIAIMTGILPSPLAKDRQIVEPVETPAPRAQALRSEERTASSAAANYRAALGEHREPTPAPRPRRAETPPVGATGSASAPRRAAESEPRRLPQTEPRRLAQTEARRAPDAETPRRVAAVCTSCGTVTSVRAVRQQGDAGMIGPAVGTAIGGAIGSQIGGGSGKTIATIVGAAGGAAIGTEIERRQKATTHYVVNVRLNDGTMRTFTYPAAPGVDQGDRVRLVDGRLVRES